MEQRRQIMIGMQGTGKTTFVAALYHVIESGQVKEALQLIEQEDTRDYLVNLREQWLGGEEVDRTKLGKERVLILKLKEAVTGQVTELILPDVSGETFRDQWEKRSSTKIFDDLARQAEGVLFFIHPEKIVNPVRINLNKNVAVALKDKKDVKSTAKTPPSGKQNDSTVDWLPKFSPTQVKLIELLQFLLREPDIYPLSRIAVIISAWDSIREDYHKPGAWLSDEVPMLAQFLKSHSDRIPYKIFGVSALGGPLKIESLDSAGKPVLKDGKPVLKDNDELLRISHQAKRIEIITDIDGEYPEHDITAPVKWLMMAED